jgi:hypothetical protein
MPVEFGMRAIPNPPLRAPARLAIASWMRLLLVREAAIPVAAYAVGQPRGTVSMWRALCSRSNQGTPRNIGLG